MASPLCFDSRKDQFLRESIMVLDGAMNTEELTLMPVDGFETADEASYGPDGSSLPVFIFGDDDDYEDEDDFDDDEDDYEDEDDYDDELEDDDEEDDNEEDGGYDEDEDFDEDEDEDWDDFDE